MSDDLKTCPFCGVHPAPNGDTLHSAACYLWIQARQRTGVKGLEEALAYAWNRRAQVRVKLPDGNPYPVHGAAAYYSRQQVIDMLKAQGVEVADA